MKQGATLHEEFNALGTIVMENDRKRLALKSPAYYQHSLNRIPIGKDVTVTLSTKKSTRSQQQLRYYHVLVQMVSDHTGYTHDEVHDFVMRSRFGTKQVTLNGKTVEVRRSISNAAKMPKYECVELIEYVIALCDDLSIRVPTMEELGYIQN
jgi:hypothetical protein